MAERLTRRILLSTAAAAPMAAAPALAEPVDPIIALAARWHAAVAACNAAGADEDETDLQYEIITEIEDLLSETRPITFAGASAQLRQAIASMEGLWGEGGSCPSEECWLGSLQNVLAFLEARA